MCLGNWGLGMHKMQNRPVSAEKGSKQPKARRWCFLPAQGAHSCWQQAHLHLRGRVEQWASDPHETPWTLGPQAMYLFFSCLFLRQGFYM